MGVGRGEVEGGTGGGRIATCGGGRMEGEEEEDIRKEERD